MDSPFSLQKRCRSRTEEPCHRPTHCCLRTTRSNPSHTMYEVVWRRLSVPASVVMVLAAVCPLMEKDWPLRLFSDWLRRWSGNWPQRRCGDWPCRRCSGDAVIDHEVGSMGRGGDCTLYCSGSEKRLFLGVRALFDGPRVGCYTPNEWPGEPRAAAGDAGDSGEECRLSVHDKASGRHNNKSFNRNINIISIRK